MAPESGEAQEGPQEASIIKPLYREIAQTIGGGVTPERVKRVIDLSNKGKHLFHGVKNNSHMPKILEEGIGPKTAEGGYVSYWTIGWRIFSSRSDRLGRMGTYGTTFFHHGASRSKEPKKSYMNIVVTNKEALDSIQPTDISENETVTLNFHVPRSKMHVLRVKLDKGETDYSERTYKRLAEQKMFDLIENALTEEYKPGGLTLAQISAPKPPR